MSETKADRIKKVMEFFNLSQKELSVVLDITQAGVSKMLLRDSISNDVVEQLSKSYGVNKIWLLNGIGEMFDKAEKTETKNEGAVHLSASRLYELWQECDKERKQIMQIVIQLTDQLQTKDELLKQKIKIS